MKERTARAVPWAVLESASIGAGSIVSTVVLARLLEPSDFGAAAVAIAVVVLVESVIMIGLNESLVQRRPLDMLHIDSGFWAMTGLGFLGTVTCAAIAHPVAALYGHSVLAGLIAVQGLSCVFTGLGGLPDALLTRKLRLKTLAKRTIAAHVSLVLVAIAMALNDFGAWSIIVAGVFSQFIGCIMLWTGRRRFPKARFSFAHLRDLLRYGVFSTLEGMLWLAVSRVFIGLVGYYHGLQALGYVSLAFRVVDVMSRVFSMVTRRFSLPLFAAVRGNQQHLHSAFLQSKTFTTLVVSPAFAGIVVTAPELVVTIFGQRWMPAAPLLQVVAALSFFSFSWGLAGTLLKAISRPELLILPALVAFVITVAGVFATAGAPVFLAALVWGARVVVTLPILIWLLNRYAGIGAGTQVGAGATALAGSTAMAFGVLCVRELVANYSPAERLAMMVATGVVLYPLVMLVIDRPVIRYCCAILNLAAAPAWLRTARWHRHTF
jgi:O-antigen/teichoic acid export membrane protein